LLGDARLDGDNDFNWSAQCAKYNIPHPKGRFLNHSEIKVSQDSIFLFVCFEDSSVLRGCDDFRVKLRTKGRGWDQEGCLMYAFISHLMNLTGQLKDFSETERGRERSVFSGIMIPLHVVATGRRGEKLPEAAAGERRIPSSTKATTPHI
jgi:hypothetical protein